VIVLFPVSLHVVYWIGIIEKHASCLVAIIRFRNILLLLTHVDAIQRKSYEEYHSLWDHGNQKRVPPPPAWVHPMCSWILLSSLPQDLRASIYLLCTCVCLVWRMKLFSKGIPLSKTFFTILGKGGIDYAILVRVLTVSSSPRMFYSHSKIRYFPKILHQEERVYLQCILWVQQGIWKSC
jgi:hypothetical protein